eukprot:9500663-Pyramimonas_sp.AAC.2
MALMNRSSIFKSRRVGNRTLLPWIIVALVAGITLGTIAPLYLGLLQHHKVNMTEEISLRSSTRRSSRERGLPKVMLKSVEKPTITRADVSVQTQEISCPVYVGPGYDKRYDFPPALSSASRLVDE